MSAKRRKNKTWRELNLSDDYLFAKVMSDRNVCKAVLEKLLEISIENPTDEMSENCQSELVKVVHKRVMEVKESKELEVEYMTLMQREREIGEKEREKGRKEGRKQGRKQGRKEGEARGARMLQLRYMGKSYEEIAKIMKANVREVSSFLKEYETFTIV